MCLFIDILEPASMRPIVRAEFTRERKLDRGNANPGSLGQDYGRLGIEFWDEVRKLSPRNSARSQALEMLNSWRNAIAHQDFDPAKLGSSKLGLSPGQEVAWGMRRPGAEHSIGLCEFTFAR